MTHHPMRDAQVHVFARVGANGTGAQAVARLYPYDTYPNVFAGSSADDVRGKAEQFIADAVAQNEAAYVAKLAALTLGRARKKARALERGAS